MNTDPHADQPVLSAGAAIDRAASSDAEGDRAKRDRSASDRARAALILLHGRGSRAEEILSLAREFDVDGVAFLAPQAAFGTWYPNRFVAPVESNEPWLTSALGAVGRLVDAVTSAGIPRTRTALLGFSQGACLALEYAARFPARLGGVAALSGGLIENGDRTRDYSGDLAGTPVFLGCSDRDAHIPLARIQRSEQVLAALGAAVTTRIYPGMGHTINRDEIDWVQTLLDDLAA